MKNVLLLVHDDPGQEGRFQAALDLARALNGHLTCLDVVWTPPIISDGFYDNAYAVAEVLTQERSREASNKLRLEERLQHEDVPWNWLDASGDFAPCLERAASLADVIVVSLHLQSPELPALQRTASELVARSGKPVLAVPVDLKRLEFNAALVAWDGSIASGHALRAAIPLLQKTTRVTLLAIDDGSIITPPEDAATYLSRHGVHAIVGQLPSACAGAGKTLLKEVTEGGHDYVVMGGFGHARWREAMFGGVTREMLTHSPVPVLLAH